MYPIIALSFLTLFTWGVTIWAMNSESEKTNAAEKSEPSFEEHDYRKAA